ncbi:MAG: hypothetical protein KGR26_15645 [Cyanobacteria bacterium REEB65]|nr:hypothetical protein [Cyanobacteria bacterium REEB65]
MGKMSRQKGKAFERLVARKFRDIYGAGVKRTLLSQARDGEEASDVEGAGPFGIECKHHRRVNVQAAFKQAQAACKRTGKVPLVVSRDNNGPVLATLELDKLLWLASCAKTYSQVEEPPERKVESGAPFYEPVGREGGQEVLKQVEAEPAKPSKLGLLTPEVQK